MLDILSALKNGDSPSALPGIAGDGYFNGFLSAADLHISCGKAVSLELQLHSFGGAPYSL